jgi:hypothetical protein
LAAIVLGVGTWLVCDNLAPDATVPSNLMGFFVSVVAMVLGSLAPQLLGNRGVSIETAVHEARA